MPELLKSTRFPTSTPHTVRPNWPLDASVKAADPNLWVCPQTTLLPSLLAPFKAVCPGTWLRPYNALSNGEKFRVEMARVLCENEGLAPFIPGSTVKKYI